MENNTENLKVILKDISSSEKVDNAIALLSQFSANPEVKVETDLVIVMHNDKNYMCIKLSENNYRNVFSYSYTNNEINSLDGIAGVLFQQDHIIKFNPDIEIIQNIYPANMVLAYLSALKELFSKRGV